MLSDLVQSLTGQMIELRRELHRHPELAFAEYKTTKEIGDALNQLGVAYSVLDCGTGLVAEVGTSGPTVAYRADIDALPLQEGTDVPFRSHVDGVMHACGHDAHTAIGVGIAGVLSQIESLPGRVRILFQPAEEGFPGGASKMVKEGSLGEAKSILAIHVDPSLRAGEIGLKTGAITSSSDRFRILLSGPGGHTARPHESADTIFAAGKIITELEALLTRNTDVREPRVLTFGQVSGGQAANVIPTNVMLAGTVRIAGNELWSKIEAIFTKLVGQIVAPTGVTATVEYEKGIAPVINDPAIIRCAGRAGEAQLPPGAVKPAHMSMGAEDFSAFTELIPGALVRLGCQGPNGKTPLHSSTFDLDEGSIRTGILFGAATLIEMLND